MKMFKRTLVLKHMLKILSRGPKLMLSTSSSAIFTLLYSFLLEVDEQLTNLNSALVFMFLTAFFFAFWVVISRTFYLTDEKVQNWEYCAEGALNIAARYRGQNKDLQGKVLRLRKQNNPISKMTSNNSSPIVSRTFSSDIDEEDPTMTIDYEEGLQDANLFIENIMVPLFGRKFIKPSSVVQLDCTFIRNLAKHIDPQRPSKRKEKSSLNEKAGVGLLMTDNAIIPCGCGKKDKCKSFCFEIKPKWGFLSQETKKWPVKNRIDRFTMHQQLKLRLNQNNEISEYFPLDFFNGGENGIFHSSKRLARTPQNNLRLFVDGFQRFPSLSKDDESLDDIFKKDLQNELITLFEVFKTIASLLHKEHIVEKLVHAQTLGPLNDIESVYPYYLQMVANGEKIENLNEKLYYYPKVGTDNPKDRIEIVRRFLISCTARDCSLMVCISQCTAPNRQVLGRENGFCYDIAVVDLDAKPLNKMEYYFTIDEDIAKSFTELEEHGVL